MAKREGTKYTPVPEKAHAQVKSYAALKGVHVPDAYAELIAVAIEAIKKN